MPAQYDEMRCNETPKCLMPSLVILVDIGESWTLIAQLCDGTEEASWLQNEAGARGYCGAREVGRLGRRSAG